MKTLEEKIFVVLQEEKRHYSAKSLSNGMLGSFNLQKGDGWAIAGQVPVLILNSPATTYINSINADLLFKLYASLNTTDRENFVKILLQQLDSKSSFALIAYLPFFVLHRVGEVIPAIQIANTNLVSNFGYDNLFAMLAKILHFEWSLFSEDDLDKLKEALQRNVYSIRERINSIELALLEKELDHVNQEINEDKEKLKKEFKRYSFPDDLTDTLNKIDEKFNSASDSFDYKGCMDLIRSFTERLYQSIAKVIDQEEKIKIDVKDSEKTAKYFKEKGLISHDQSEILTSLRHFLSNNASHRLKSHLEDARLSKNMTIEFSLYLIERMKSLQE